MAMKNDLAVFISLSGTALRDLSRRGSKGQDGAAASEDRGRAAGARDVRRDSQIGRTRPRVLSPGAAGMVRDRAPPCMNCAPLMRQCPSQGACPPHQGFKKSSCEDPKSCIASPFGTSSTKQSSDGMTHQRRTSLLTKDEQSTSSIGSTLTWSLVSSGACIRASLKILRLALFSPQVSPAAPTP